MKIFDLPEVIHQEVQCYLSQDDFRIFLNCSNSEDARMIKKKTVYFSFHPKTSSRYLHDAEFRAYILSLVNDSSKQISLNCGFMVDLQELYCKASRSLVNVHSINFHFNMIAPDVELLIGVSHILELVTESDPFPFLPNLRKICLQNSNISDLRYLSHVHQVSIHHNYQLNNIEPLKLVPFLTLEDCPHITDFSSLGRQIRLRLINCSGLIACENFSKIKHLAILECHNIPANITCLRGVYDLEIKSSNVKDISCLGDHYRLSAHSINYGFEILKNIPRVELFLCAISDVTVLKNAKSVRLQSCHGVVDVSPLINAEELYLLTCSKINDIQMLGNIPYLELRDFSSSAIMPAKVKHHTLAISSHYFGPPPFPNNLIGNRVSINTTFFRSLQEFSNPFEFLRRLDLNYVDNLARLKGCSDIYEINILVCSSLIDISDLGNNHTVRIEGCFRLEDVRSLANVPIVTIIGCSRIRDFTCLAKVPRLKIV